MGPKCDHKSTYKGGRGRSDYRDGRVGDVMMKQREM